MLNSLHSTKRVIVFAKQLVGKHLFQHVDIALKCVAHCTAYFVLSGIGGTFAIGAVGMPYGTVILDGTLQDITGISNLGTFTIIGNQLIVQLSDDADGRVIADAIRLEEV